MTVSASEPGNYLIRAPESYRTVPWRNGRGETLVLLSEPASDPGDFAWRLSIAAVDSDGPFSRFDGVDRTLVLLEGPGVTLEHGDGQVDELNARFDQASFPGDIGTIATLHDGPIRDFNVMSGRRYCSATVRALSGDGADERIVDGDVLLVYAVDRPMQLVSPRGQTVSIDKHHLLRSDQPDRGRWTFSGAPAIAIQIDYR